MVEPQQKKLSQREILASGGPQLLVVLLCGKNNEAVELNAGVHGDASLCFSGFVSKLRVNGCKKPLQLYCADSSNVWSSSLEMEALAYRGERTKT